MHSEPCSDRPSIAVVIESGHSFTPLACGHFKIRRDTIQMRIAEQPLYGVERVALCYQTARKRSAATMAAITGTEASGTVQTCDIALEAVGREVFDRLTSKLTAA